MNFQQAFSAALAALPANAGYRVINGTRQPGDYFLDQFLPEKNMASFDINAGAMSITPTMAGLVGMDSPYPPSGQISVSRFAEKSAKIASSVPLSENAIREFMQWFQLTNPTQAQIQTELLAYIRQVVAQSHWDTAEWLRGQALSTGKIQWTFNGLNLDVNYGVPSANILTPSTGADGYGSTNSKFWRDVALLQKALGYSVRAFITHTSTWLTILGNRDVNKIEVVGQGAGYFDITRIVGTTERRSTDATEAIRVYVYGAEGQAIDPLNPSAPAVKVPFLEKGKFIGIGTNVRSGYSVGQGAIPALNDGKAIGYTHIAPTIENALSGNGLGRFARIYVPENRQWQIIGEGVTNLLPVIEAPEKLAIATTDGVA